MKYIFILLLSVLLVTNSFAVENYGFFLGVNGGQASDTGQDIEEMKGSAFGMNLGYRWINWAIELGYSKYDLKAERGQADKFFIDKAEMDATSLDVTLRGFLFRYITVATGLNMVDSDEDFLLTNVEGNASATISSKGESSYSGTFFQAGLVLPMLRNFDVWLLWQQRNWTRQDASFDSSGNLSIDDINFKINQYSAHFVYYFN